MKRLRVLLYASGSPSSIAALDAVAAVADVVGIVVPSLRQPALRKKSIPLIEFGQPTPDADLMCIASFPRIIAQPQIDRMSLGGINIHPSLLPRHRGPDPLFWTYFDDDREAGVTVHALGKGIDDGDVILQEAIPLERGLRGYDLYFRLAGIGAKLAANAVQQFADGTVKPVPQDESLATTERSPARRTWSVDYDTWPAERLWHFLRGVEHREAFTLPDRDGKEHTIGKPLGYSVAGHGIAPGTIERNTAYTRDGSVTWSAPPMRRRLLNALRAIPNRRRL